MAGTEPAEDMEPAAGAGAGAFGAGAPQEANGGGPAFSEKSFVGYEVLKKAKSLN